MFFKFFFVVICTAVDVLFGSLYVIGSVNGSNPLIYG